MKDVIELNAVSAPPASGEAKRLIVFLHGYGADGNDLIALAPVFAEQFPDCAFASPGAPFPCEAGFGRQWFGLADWSPAALHQGVVQALPSLNAFIDGEMQRWNVAAGDVALFGFSQGAMMALAAGLRRAPALGGILAFSGALTGIGTLPADIVSRPLVLLVHGDLDEVVPFGALRQAEAALKAEAVPVESIACAGLGHAIDQSGLTAALRFLHQIWGVAPSIANKKLFLTSSR